MPIKFEPATGNPRLNGVVVTADDKSGRASLVTRISYSEQDLVHQHKPTDHLHAHQR